MLFKTEEILVIINRLIFGYSLVPLFLKNYQLKTARGLSDGLTWMLFNAYIALAYYSFCLKLPAPYGISSVCQIGIMFAIACQRFYYDDFSYKNKLLFMYVINSIAALALMPLALSLPIKFGHVAGWITAILFSVNRIPQMIKIQRSRSTYGFSYSFVFLLGIGSLLEFTLSIVYHYPLQTVLMSVWAFTAFLIFTAQFYAFAWRENKILVNQKELLLD